MAFEIGGLVGHDGVTHRVGLVEGVIGKIVDLIVNVFPQWPPDPVGHAAGDPPVRVAVEKGVLFLLDLLGLFLEMARRTMSAPPRE